jgi:hypothetical protein
MFTVLSNSRNSNLYLIASLVTATILLLTFAVVPAISLGKQAPVAVPGASETGSDYYLRHLELRVPAAVNIDVQGDFHLRHPGWSAAGVAMPAAENFQRPGMACESPVDCR